MYLLSVYKDEGLCYASALPLYLPYETTTHSHLNRLPSAEIRFLITVENR